MFSAAASDIMHIRGLFYRQAEWYREISVSSLQNAETERFFYRIRRKFT